MTRGILYWFCGVRYAERLVVSAFSLRRHWDGPIHVVCTDDDCEAICARMHGDARIRSGYSRVEMTRFKRHSMYVNKTLLPTWSPFDQTVFLDGDTVVAGPIDELFEPRVAITRFGEWQSKGGTMSKRIGRWRGISPAVDALVAKQLASKHPAINTGVVGWHRGTAELAVWHQLAVAGHARDMTDELAMQLLQTEIPGLKVFDDRFNCSPIYGSHQGDARVWHFHGDKHLRRDVGRRIWQPVFDEARAANVAGLGEWAGKYDKHVRKLAA